MNNWQQKIGKWAADHLELPSDVLLELPRITIIGQLHVYIENHKGLLIFSDQELRLKLKVGQLQVKGKDFVIKAMLPEEIVLEGTIKSLKFLKD
ncbi:sporulation protein YqfC [Bacillaceae bacterium S4-13-58]